VSLQTNNNQRGIALGPILFIIAILAILAAAIAAGMGGFNANTNTESAKAIAETIINTCGAYQDAENKVLGNGCDPTLLDYTPNLSLPSGTTLTGASLDQTGGNGTNQAGNGQCALFDIRGGGLIWTQVLPNGLASNLATAYASSDPVNYPAFAGYPVINVTNCLYQEGLCAPALATSTSNAAIILYIHGLNANVCQQINVNLNLPSALTSLTTLQGTTAQKIGEQIAYSVFGSGHHGMIRSAGDGTGVTAVTSSSNYNAGITLQACVADYFTSPWTTPGLAYVHMCALFIR
jgi:hypothetical protein